MATRGKGVDYGAWARTLAPMIILGVLGFVGLVYQQQSNSSAMRSTLEKHDTQFKEVGNQFEKFNNTLQKNYSDWAAATKLEAEKSEKNAKEEREVRERMREQFMALFSQLSNNSATTSEQVKSIGKQLDGVTTKIDSIQNVQRERALQTPTGRR